MILILLVLVSGCVQEPEVQKPEKSDCPYECCVYGEYETRACPDGYECKGNVCVGITREFKEVVETRFGGGGTYSTDFDSMEELGVHFKRMGAGIGKGGSINFEVWDDQLEKAQEKGIWFMGLIDPIPDQNGDFPTAKEFALEFKKIVEKYDGDGIDDLPGLKYPIKYYELCNEIKFIAEGMGIGEWEGFTQKNYLDLFTKASEVMKEACSDCRLSAGSIVDSEADKVERALGYLVENGAKDNIDFISYHAYEEYLDVDRLMDKLSDFGLMDRPVFLTESQFGGTHEKIDVSQEELAKIQTRSYVYALAKGIDKLMPAELSALPIYPEGLKWSCMIDENGQKRDSFYAYKTLVSELDFFTGVREINRYQYEFSVGNKKIYVLWGTGELPPEIKGKVKVTTIDGQGKEMEASEVKLSDSPIFMELIS